MFIYFCATCGATVNDEAIKTGIAVQVASDKVHCFKCITNRVAKVSESAILRAIAAKRSQSLMVRSVNNVRYISQRLVAQMPEGRMKRVVRRVSQRILGIKTGAFDKVKTGAFSPVKSGSSPRNRVGSN